MVIKDVPIWRIIMNLSIKEGYLTMFYFIEEIYEDNSDDDIGAILGDLSPFTFMNCMSADPAAWSDWNNIINEYKVNDVEKKYLNENELLNVIVLFLNEFAGACFNLKIVHNAIAHLRDNNSDIILIRMWKQAINKSIQENELL